MKKISLFALALSTSLAMFAQNNQNVTPMADKVYFGIKGGVNLAEFRVHDYPTHLGTEMKTSMHGGFLVNIPVAGSFHVQPELIYSGEGSKLTETTALGS